jgi:hypothetical protein
LVNEKWMLLQGLEAPVDWLILGDSSANQGVVPDVLADDPAESAVNLATVASLTAVDDVWMLQTYIDQFGPPSNVLIVHTYDIWRRDVLPIMVAKTPIPWGSWNQMGPSLDLSFTEKTDVFLGRFLPIYADNEALVQIIYNGGFGPQRLFKKRFSLQSDGYMPFYNASPERVIVDSDTHIKSVSRRKYEMSAINAAAIAEIVLLAEQYQFDVYLATGPVYEGVFESEAFRSYYAEVQDSLRQFGMESDHLHFLELTAVFPADTMENVDHVIDTAAVEYTKMLVEAVNRTE